MRLTFSLVIASLIIDLSVGAGAAHANPNRRTGPMTQAQGFPGAGGGPDNAQIRNKWRERIVNQFLKKRGVPQTITSTVSSLKWFESWNIVQAFSESTFGMLSRGLWAKMPGGSKSYYSGLHPRSIEYWFDDKTTRLQIAHCFLDFYSSRVIPGRIFIRSRHCAEHPFAVATSGYKGYHYAGVVQVERGRLSKFKDLTNDLVKLGVIDSDSQFLTYLTDQSLFEDPSKAPRGGDDEQDDGAGGGGPGS